VVANDIINGALRLIGVLAANEQPSYQESNNALVSLNNMLDAWSAQKLTAYQRVAETFAFVAGQQSYQMGLSGTPDWSTARPSEIENMVWQQIQGSTTFQFQIQIINQDQWAALTVPTVTSNISTKCWPNYTYPNLTLNFWPIPSAAYNIYMISWKPLSSFTTLQTAVSLPPAYTKAIIWNLAVDLTPEYGKPQRTDIIQMATNLHAQLKRVNQKPVLLGQDSGVISKKPGFNWITGE
jgi:hypothetical protein